MGQTAASLPLKWCSREDSNLHRFPYMILSHTRLPVPPREQKLGARIEAAPALAGKGSFHKSANGLSRREYLRQRDDDIRERQRRRHTFG